MAVLLEAASVLVRVQSIVGKYSGGAEQFRRDIPNATACGDGELVRVGFMNPEDAVRFIELLRHRGLTHLDPNGLPADIAAVDAVTGPWHPCEWLEFGSVDLQEANSGQKASVRWARLKGGQSQHLSLPVNWRPASIQFVPASRIEEKLRFLRRENNLDVFEDLETGKEVYVGRPILQRND